MLKKITSSYKDYNDRLHNILGIFLILTPILCILSFAAANSSVWSNSLRLQVNACLGVWFFISSGFTIYSLIILRRARDIYLQDTKQKENIIVDLNSQFIKQQELKIIKNLIVTLQPWQNYLLLKLLWK